MTFSCQHCWYIPAHVYQGTFSPNSQWTEGFAQGPKIRAYWQKVVAEHDVYRYIKFDKRIEQEQAQWHAAEGEWVLQINNLKRKKNTAERFDILITTISHFNAWKLQDYLGINDYQGHSRHSSS
jgi:cation diffusion facilitator CzcD-associated flavoprotein CzcO